MPLKPPKKGMSPVVATRPIPAGVRAAVIAGVAVAAVALFFLELSGAAGALGPLKYGLFGLLGAAAVVVPKYSSYAAGTDWIRRGDNWVITTELTKATSDGQTLRLRDSSSRRKIALQLDVLAHHQELFAALAGGVRYSQSAGTLHADEHARALFSLPLGTEAR